MPRVIVRSDVIPRPDGRADPEADDAIAEAARANLQGKLDAAYKELEATGQLVGVSAEIVVGTPSFDAAGVAVQGHIDY